MKKREFFYPSSDGIHLIHAIEWIPDKIEAILQITHGMCEYIDRYDDFASYLCKHNIYVVGEDHLGHGYSVNDNTELGYFNKTNGKKYIISDKEYLRNQIKMKYKDIPYYMLGHSMGSFILRMFLQIYGDKVDGAIIMGTGYQSLSVLKSGKNMCQILKNIKGDTYRSSFIYNIAFGAYNKKINNPKTNYDWLSKDENIVNDYCNNPLNNFIFTINGFYTLFDIIDYIQNDNHLKKMPKDLSLFIVSGLDDPVGNYGKDVLKVYLTLKKYVKNIKLKLYPGERHEILNETNKHIVYSDILEWITMQNNGKKYK